MKNTALSDLLTPEGRTNRLKFFLITTVILTITASINIYIQNNQDLSMGYSMAFLIALTFMLYVSIVNTIKRLHDIDKSGWYSIIMFVPYTSAALGLLLMVIKGNESKNQYGENPLKGKVVKKAPAKKAVKKSTAKKPATKKVAKKKTATKKKK